MVIAAGTTAAVLPESMFSYVLTLTTPDEQAAGYADSFDQIGTSFQLLG